MAEANRDAGLVAFAERVLTLLDQGSFVATYKYAVLIGLMDLCLEKTQRKGVPPESVTTRQLAEKVVELYWPHTTAFPSANAVLKQNTGRQARILSDILEFRTGCGDGSLTLFGARCQNPVGFERLLDKVEWTLILMPLPRLQVVGRHVEPILYRIGWGLEIEKDRASVTAYQRSRPSSFQNTITFLPDVADHLVRLNGLLRPLIYRAWSAMVAQMNQLEQAQLEGFLFGIDRTPLGALKPALLDLQGGRCFYCGTSVREGAEVDHFLPWSRYPDNGIQNLVVADRKCNGLKRNFLAAAEHVHHWSDRNRDRATDLDDIANTLRWETHGSLTLGVARGLYLRLPPSARLWVKGQEFVSADRSMLQAALD